MTDTKFAVSSFKNRNGVTSWRVSGWLAGVRIRKNFKSRTEAAAEKAVLELKAIQLASNLRRATTSLSDEQLREAEAAFERLKTRPKGLTFYLDYALSTYREPVAAKPLGEAVAAYLDTKQRQRERDLLSKSQLQSISKELAVFTTRFPTAVLSEITPAGVAAYCERNGVP
ncbi:MAG: hypothetical protein ACREIA_13055 [Opitutaceae bacterium]